MNKIKKTKCLQIAEEMVSEQGWIGCSELIEMLKKAGYKLPTSRTIRNWITEFANEKDLVQTKGPVFY